MQVELSETSIKRLAEVIGDKILQSRNQPEPWISIDELAVALRISKKTIYKYTSTTNIPCKRGRPLRFKRTEVEAWLRQR